MPESEPMTRIPSEASRDFTVLGWPALSSGAPAERYIQPWDSYDGKELRRTPGISRFRVFELPSRAMAR